MRAYVAYLLFALVAALLVPISAGAQADASCTAVFDMDGTRVARATTQGGTTNVFFANQGRVAQFRVIMNELQADLVLYFTGENCTGDEYMVWETRVQPDSHRVGTDVWHPDTMAVPAPLSPGSVRQAESGQCSNSVGAVSLAVPALNFTLPAFTPPFHLEPEPCSIPPDPNPEQIIDACMKNKGGALRIVADPADCNARETPITLLSP